MALKQIRYYGSKNENNFPKLEEVKDEIRGNSDLETIQNLLSEKPITKIGIQSVPGLQFYLNGYNQFPIEINGSGIFEIDLQNMVTINQIEFDKTRWQELAKTPKGIPYFLLIDYETAN